MQAARRLPRVRGQNALHVCAERTVRELFKEVGFFARDASEKRLELEPPRHVISYLFSGGNGGGVIDLFGGAN